jgi:hypothetical protein
MPRVYPIAAAGERLPKHARPLGASLKAAARLLVWGFPDGDGHRPATLVEAAAAGSMRPDTLRRYLRRPDMRALIASERKALLAWAMGANPQALMSIRDTSLNDAARVRAALALEEIGEPRQGSGVTVNVSQQTIAGVAIRPGYVIRMPAEIAPPEAFPAEDAEPR